MREPWVPEHSNYTRIDSQFYRITTVLVSHFLIDLHSTQKKISHESSFLSLDIMSRLGTVQSAVFQHPVTGISTIDIPETDGEEPTHSPEDMSMDNNSVWCCTEVWYRSSSTYSFLIRLQVESNLPKNKASIPTCVGSEPWPHGSSWW